ncbi:MAG: hypothetical protein FWD47_10495 [Treponema sp.]|nr:hypothetical protein [Treponema sp.]
MDKKKKINLIIIGAAILIFPLVMVIASFLGERSVNDLKNFGVYSLVASENEKIGSNMYRVEYYVCNGSFDLNTLAELCRKKRNIYRNSSTFAGYYMVVFNDKDNVSKSTYPITAKYGSEIDKLRNIYAFYTFGGSGSILLSELNYYRINAADSVAIKVKIE